MRSAALIGAVALLVTSVGSRMAVAQSPPVSLSVADDASGGSNIEIASGHQFAVELGANPTAGYTWRLDAGSSRLQLKSREYRPVAAPAARLGAGGTERFVFEAAAPGTERVHFEYRRGSAGEPARTYDLTVTIVP